MHLSNRKYFGKLPQAMNFYFQMPRAARFFIAVSEGHKSPEIANEKPDLINYIVCASERNATRSTSSSWVRTGVKSVISD